MSRELHLSMFLKGWKSVSCVFGETSSRAMFYEVGWILAERRFCTIYAKSPAVGIKTKMDKSYTPPESLMPLRLAGDPLLHPGGYHFGLHGHFTNSIYTMLFSRFL